MSPRDPTRSDQPPSNEWDPDWDDEAYDDTYDDAGDAGSARSEDGDHTDLYAGDAWGDDEWDDEEWDDEPADVTWERPTGDEPDVVPQSRRARRAAATEYEELRPESTRRRRVLVVFGAILLFLLLLVGGLLWWVRGELDPAGSAGAEVELTIPTGSSTSAIANLLEDEGIIANAQVFRWYLRYKGASDFQAGQFTFQEDMAAWDALAVLRAGPEAPPFLQFTVPEGLTLAQAVDAIAEYVPGFDRQLLLELVTTGQVLPASLPPGSPSLEGFLFPDTYRLDEAATPLAALQAMAAQFDTVAAEVGLSAAPDLVGLSPYETVVVASLVQEEAANAAEMPQVARVIYNRIAEGMRLEIDASLCYGLNKPCSDITASDLQSTNEYNLRTTDGLPPTPIALPGRDALNAALHPAEGPWLYYVLDPQVPDGGHLFTDDYDEFLAAKDRCEAANLGCG